MKRYLALLGITASLICCSISTADPPKVDTADAPIVERLDAILRRLDAIEKRLAVVEADRKLLSGWTVDDRGVLRLPNGQPVGFWGIDGPMPMQAR